MGALDEMEAQRARAQAWTNLQKARRSKACNRVRYGHCFPPEYPAGHRKSNRRVTQMHEPHTHPQWIDRLVPFRGGTSKSFYRHNSNG